MPKVKWVEKNKEKGGFTRATAVGPSGDQLVVQRSVTQSVCQASKSSARKVVVPPQSPPMSFHRSLKMRESQQMPFVPPKKQSQCFATKGQQASSRISFSGGEGGRGSQNFDDCKRSDCQSEVAPITQAGNPSKGLH